MAISFVGSWAQPNASGADLNIPFSNLLNEAGAAPTLQQGDLVVVAVAYRTTSGEWDKTPTDGTNPYTPAFPDVFQTNTQCLSFKVSYKFMGATPDTSVTIPVGATSNSGAIAIHVFRGVDTTTPIDVTPTTSTSTGNSTQPDAPAITPATAGAWIYVAGGYSTGSSHVNLTAPSGLNSAPNDYQSANASTSVIGAGFYSGWTSGPYDPAPFTGGSLFPGSAEAAATIALRPLFAGGGTTYNDTISESITSGDTLTGAAIFVGTISEGITAGDSETGGLLLTGTVSEALTCGYSITGSAAFAAALIETLGLSDSATSVGTFSVTYSEELTFADLYASAGGSIWTVQSAPAGSWTTQSPATGLWTNQVPPTVIWTKE